MSKLSAIFDEEKIDRRSIPVHIWNFKDETKARGLCRNKTMKNRVNPIFMAESEFERHKAKKSDFFESII